VDAATVKGVVLRLSKRHLVETGPDPDDARTLSVFAGRRRAFPVLRTRNYLVPADVPKPASGDKDYHHG